MAIRANEFTFRQLIEDKRFVVPTVDQRADLSDLLRPREMIPLHRRRMKREAAISTRFSRFEGLSPRSVVGLPALLLSDPYLAGPMVVIAVVLSTTTFAPGLSPIPGTAMKFADAFPVTTAPA
jgi:hypothetical protein